IRAQKFHPQPGIGHGASDADLRLLHGYQLTRHKNFRDILLLFALEGRRDIQADMAGSDRFLFAHMLSSLVPLMFMLIPAGSEPSGHGFLLTFQKKASSSIAHNA